jgi:hypothetical protein
MLNFFKPVFILILPFCSNILSAQLNYRAGYVITLKSDTLYGSINDGSSFRNSKECKFKSDKIGKPVKYLPGEIKEYRIVGGNYYASKPLFIRNNSKQVFAEVLIKGKTNLYTDWHNKSIKYYIEKEGGRFIGLSNESIRAQYDNESGDRVYNKYYWMVTKAYRDTLYRVFRDSKEIQKQLDNVDYTEESLIKIVKSYLDETCFDDDCLIYERDLIKSKTSSGIFVGLQLSKVTFLESKEDPKVEGRKANITCSVPIGIFYNIPLTFINRKLSFQIELLTNTINHKSFGGIEKLNFIKYIKSTTLGVPLLLKYEIAKRKISPSIAFGKETAFIVNSKVKREYTEAQLLYRSYTEDQLLHKIQKGGWFFEIGMDYKLSPKLSLFSNARFQSSSNLILAEANANRFSYSGAVKSKSYLEIYKTNFATLFVGLRF